MKLSDKKLYDLLAPLITQEVEAYGLEKLTIEGKPDQSGDEAVYVHVKISSYKFNYTDLTLKLSRLCSKHLDEADDERDICYINVTSPPDPDHIFTGFGAFIDKYQEQRLSL